MKHVACCVLENYFGWSKGGKVAYAGWQVTLCDPIWHVISCSGVVKFTNCYTLFTLLYFMDLCTTQLFQNIIKLCKLQVGDKVAHNITSLS